MEGLYRRYIIIKTEDEYAIGISLMKRMILAMGAGISLLALVASLEGITLRNFAITGFFLLIICNHIIITSMDAEEEKLLRQFEKFIGGLRHSFHETGVVEEAIQDSLETADYEVSLHIDKIYRILLEEDSYETSQYKETAPNEFFITFLVLCQVTTIYGDTFYKKQSLFLSNLNHLKNEINTELLKREKIKHVFAGLIFITLLPVFFLRIIENWSISNLPELEVYYHGGFGIIISIMIYLLTLAAYYVICRLKETYRFQRKEHPVLEAMVQIRQVKNYVIFWCRNHGKKAKQIDELLKSVGYELKLSHFIIQKIILFILIFLSLQGVICNVTAISKWNAIYNTENFYGITFADKEKDLLLYKRVITDFGGIYRNSKVQPTVVQIQSEISGKNETFSLETANKLAVEIVNRLELSRKSIYNWYYIPLSVAIAFFASYIPELILRMKKVFQRMAMEDEVMRFQMVIIMLMHLPGTDVAGILEWLENVSRIFKDSIVECMDSYYYDEEKALCTLKEREPFLPFLRIVENLENCDKVGVERAFAGMEGERGYYLDKRKQDNEIMISNKGVIGKGAAYLPLIATLGLYLIIPFVLESIARFMTYITELNGI